MASSRPTEPPAADVDARLAGEPDLVRRADLMAIVTVAAAKIANALDPVPEDVRNAVVHLGLRMATRRGG